MGICINPLPCMCAREAMRAVVFVCIVFVGLLAQYLLTEWLETDSTEERKETWDNVLKIVGHLYSQAVGNAKWVIMGSNWKYLFIVPSRVKLYESRRSREKQSAFGVDGVKVIRIDHSNKVKTTSQNSQKSTQGPQSSSPFTSEEYFAKSKVPRETRPDHVVLRVGQVVKHVRYNYYGVIVGWDDVAKAPEEWIKKNHPKSKEHWRQLPHYSVLVDKSYALFDHAYCAQDNLVPVNKQVRNTELSKYFADFNGQRYTPKAWLQALYPRDFEQ